MVIKHQFEKSPGTGLKNFALSVVNIVKVNSIIKIWIQKSLKLISLRKYSKNSIYLYEPETKYQNESIRCFKKETNLIKVVRSRSSSRKMIGGSRRLASIHLKDTKTLNYRMGYRNWFVRTHGGWIISTKNKDY